MHPICTYITNKWLTKGWVQRLTTTNNFLLCCVATHLKLHCVKKYIHFCPFANAIRLNMHSLVNAQTHITYMQVMHVCT